jgi:hypothetical protein
MKTNNNFNLKNNIVKFKIYFKNNKIKIGGLLKINSNQNKCLLNLLMN